MIINYFNNTDYEIDNLITLITKVLNDKRPFKMSIIFITDEEMKELNTKYRGIAKTTDVLSFAYQEDLGEFDTFEELGDIFISLDKATTQAKTYGHSFEREVCFLAVHGYLHLLGYDHLTEADEKEMFKLQEEILSKAGIFRCK